MNKRISVAMSLSLLLAACGQQPNVTTQGGAPTSGPRVSALGASTSTASECQSLYATAPTTVQTDSTMRYGQVGTLILSFANDVTKGQAIDWMDSNLAVDPGKGLGAFENLPMIAVRTLVTPELIAQFKTNLPGLLSVYQDAPLKYLLHESVKFVGADTAKTTYGVTGKGVGVAVIDSGVDATHADLVVGRNVGRNVKLVGSVLDTPVGGYFHVDTPNGDTSSGHGTHVASTIAGLGEASGGKYTGVAPGSTIVGIGAGDGLSILYALQGFDFAMKPEVKETHNIRVISNSWGTSGEFAPYNPISLASKRAYDAGIVVAFAAGNEGPGENTLNPYSASPCVISVAAGDKQGYLADFSSRGRKGDALVRPDVTAPGVDISAARATLGLAATTVPNTDNPMYSTISGTSMATPHISGIVALMLEAAPNLKLDQILAIFNSTSRPMYYTQTSTNGLDPNQVVTKKREAWEVGAGYVDAHAAVREAVKLNTSRFTLSTTALPSWTGTVATAVCAPTAGCVQNAKHTQTISVPSGASALRVKTDWGNPAFDLDLEVYDPAGRLVGSSAQGTSTFESVNIPAPVAGNWKVVLNGYLNAPTSYTGTAEVDRLVRR